MFEEVNILVSTQVGDILKSPDLTLKLLKIYSKLYLSGAAPGYCEKSIRKYHSQLKSDGMIRIQENIKVAERTLVPAWKGLRYYTAICTHVNADLLTDQEAIKLLETKILKESDFQKLPEGYKSKLVKVIQEPEPAAEVPEIKKVIKPKKSKK